MPAPAIDETMKNAENISNDRLSSNPAPRWSFGARLCGRRAWSIRTRLCHTIAATGRPRNLIKIKASRQPSSSIRAAVAGGAAPNPTLPMKV
jgi:hypothetical protein